MRDGETFVAWVLFWLFAAIATAGVFLVVDHHRSRPRSVLAALAVGAFFIFLFLGLKALMRWLGL